MQNYTTMWTQKLLHITLKMAKLQIFKIYTNSLSLITSVLIRCPSLHVYNFFLQYSDVINQNEKQYIFNVIKMFALKHLRLIHY